MQERKNIYLIYKEAINNVYKYSGATTVTVSTKKDANNLMLSITDNGKGFGAEEKTKNGNGLTNMKNRAEEIRGVLLIKSITAEGTQVLLKLPVV